MQNRFRFRSRFRWRLTHTKETENNNNNAAPFAFGRYLHSKDFKECLLKDKGAEISYFEIYEARAFYLILFFSLRRPFI